MRQELLKIAESSNTGEIACSFVSVAKAKEKVITKALKSYAKTCSRDQIVAIMDTTLFGGGKAGFILTEKKLYSSHFFHLGKNEISLEGLVKAEVDTSNKNIYLTYEDGTSVSFYVSVFTKTILNLLQSIIQLKAEREEQKRLIEQQKEAREKQKHLIAQQKEAREQFEKGLKKAKSPEGNYKMGRYCLKGDGYKIYYEKAAEFFERSAQAEHPKAQYQLALLYLEGNGVEKDLEKARYWCGKAKEQGEKAAVKLWDEIVGME